MARLTRKKEDKDAGRVAGAVVLSSAATPVRSEPAAPAEPAGAVALIDGRISDLSGELNEPPERKRAVYDAFMSHDMRFDGRIFVGVSSTKIYCRPTCHARQPKIENCRFFHSAAEAESAGYRPCLNCRPELAPGLASVDAQASLARRAASYLREHCTEGVGIEQMATRLGYGERQLRRAFQAELGISPARYLTTCRLLLAKALLADSDVPVGQVAVAAGFKSTRQFNDQFKRHYRMTPSDVRRRRRKAAAPAGCIRFKLGYREPYRFAELLGFFRTRALREVELVDGESYARTVRIEADGVWHTGWLRVTDNPAAHALELQMDESLLPVTSQVVARVRRQFDLDCDPYAVFEGIDSLNQKVPGAAILGTRLPGAFEPFETAVRAVLGQQISVVAAGNLAARVIEAYGPPIDTDIKGLTRSFPTADEILAIDDIEAALGVLGVIKARSRVIAQIARQLRDGELDFDARADAPAQIERLVAIKGIGPWTANYIAMRVLSYPDAFLETDVGVKHALPDLSPKERLAFVEQWRPWRSYVNIGLWNSLS